ncbi:MAG: CDP-alcohol phosphatidyltransferase family protein [Acidimicrobiia bacterium]|nr:CDP-alcohol phosphatidyltransferase family protein [Acidimicrobiia bacterium]
MFTIPNLISLVRLALIPVFLWLLVGRDEPVWAGILLGVIGSTDWVDGYLARKLDQVSEIGKILDPLADRLAVATAVIAGLVSGYLPGWFAWALIVREALVGVGAMIVALLGHTSLAVRQLGKVATFLLYNAVAWFFVGVEWDPALYIAWFTGVPGLILYYVVATQYATDAIAAIRARNEGPT